MKGRASVDLICIPLSDQRADALLEIQKILALAHLHRSPCELYWGKEFKKFSMVAHVSSVLQNMAEHVYAKFVQVRTSSYAEFVRVNILV